MKRDRWLEEFLARNKREPNPKLGTNNQCAICKKAQDYIWVETKDDELLCLECFHRTHPQWHPINREMSPGQQMKLLPDENVT